MPEDTNIKIEGKDYWINWQEWEAQTKFYDQKQRELDHLIFYGSIGCTKHDCKICNK